MKAKQLKQLKNFLIVNKSMKSKQLKNSHLGMVGCDQQQREKEGAAKREQKYWYDWLRIKGLRFKG